MITRRINELDLLRFIAAMAVVIYHYVFRAQATEGLSQLSFPLLEWWAKFGFFGVHLFFIISGFVILMSAEKGGLRHFIMSRVTRLYPAFWICCTATYLIIVWNGAPLFNVTLREYFINMTMLSGFVGVDSVDGVYWTLFVEIKFYGLIALLLVLKKIHRIEWFIYGWLIISILLEFVLPRMFLLNVLSYILITNYSGLFIAGALFYLNWKVGGSFSRYLALAISLLLVVAQELQKIPSWEYENQAELGKLSVFTLIASLYLIMFLVSTNRTGDLRNKKWVAAGAITYPLYLIHQNVGFIMFKTLDGCVHRHVALWGIVTMMLVASYIIWRNLERPLVKRMKTWSKM